MLNLHILMQMMLHFESCGTITYFISTHWPKYVFLLKRNKPDIFIYLNWRVEDQSKVDSYNILQALIVRQPDDHTTYHFCVHFVKKNAWLRPVSSNAKKYFGSAAMNYWYFGHYTSYFCTKGWNGNKCC
jgi:hypothetical protein